ncbi:hypothetical protein OKW46_002280 [Paraburkholderia sp. WSM4179]|nr:hypothetical protein [Paraburkholderia sp. WSM4179]
MMLATGTVTLAASSSMKVWLRKHGSTIASTPRFSNARIVSNTWILNCGSVASGAAGPCHARGSKIRSKGRAAPGRRDAVLIRLRMSALANCAAPVATPSERKRFMIRSPGRSVRPPSITGGFLCA